MRLLFLMRDPLPPLRADVALLFGRELPRLGVHSDLLGQWASGGAETDAVWPAGRLFLQGSDQPGWLAALLRPLQDLAFCWRLSDAHQLIQVRDKIFGALMVRLLAGWRRPWTYWMSFPIAEGHAQRAREIGGRGPRAWAHALRARAAHHVFYRCVAPHADHVFVQSEAMLAHMLANGVPRERLSAVPMGVDTQMLSAISPLTPRPAAWAGRRVIAYLGSLGRARDPEFLLRALRCLRQSEPQALLLLIGDAPSADERAWLRERIAASGLQDHVQLSGWLPQSEALRWLASSELAWSPIPRGPLFDVSSPTKLVEALGLGLPCVANDIPDQALVLAQSGAGLCVPLEPEAFAAASLRLLREPTTRAAMAARGPAWVRQHRDVAVLAAAVAAVYQGLAAR